MSCSKFGVSGVDPVKGAWVNNMKCEEAMSDFCGLSYWGPRFFRRWARRISLGFIT